MLQIRTLQPGVGSGHWQFHINLIIKKKVGKHHPSLSPFLLLYLSLFNKWIYTTASLVRPEEDGI